MEPMSTEPMGTRISKSLRAVMRKRCPACGKGRAFRAWGRFMPACDVCGRTFARLSGSSTGTMQVGSMATVLFAIVAWFVVRAVTDLSLDPALIVTMSASAIFGVWFFPYAKLIWEAVDYVIDSSDEGNQ